MKVLIWIPTYDGWIHRHVNDITDLLLQDDRCEKHIIRSQERPVEVNLNLGCKTAFEMNADYLLILDNDNPPRKNPLDLLELDLDVVTVSTPIFNAKALQKGRFPLFLNGFMYDKEEDGYRPISEHLTGLKEVDAVGAGCLLISRRVLEDESIRPPFERRVDEWGVTTRGPDFIFCEKVRAAGFRVWINYDYYCNHIKQIGLVELNDTIKMALKARENKTNGEGENKDAV